MNPPPRIRRAARLQGKSLTFVDAHPADAEFITKLRTDEVKSRHISATSQDIDAQARWLEGYRSGEGQAYFIIQSDGARVGTVRLYDAQGRSFCWGSWILGHDAPTHAAIESALMVYAYALDVLGFSEAHFEVRRANERVWKFHERFGALRTSEDEMDIHYTLANAAILASRDRYKRFLPNGIECDGLAQGPGHG